MENNTVSLSRDHVIVPGTVRCVIYDVMFTDANVHFM